MGGFLTIHYSRFAIIAVFVASLWSAASAASILGKSDASTPPRPFSQRILEARTACLNPQRPLAVRERPFDTESLRQKYVRNMIPEASLKGIYLPTTLDVHGTQYASELKDLASELRQWGASQKASRVSIACAAACITDHLFKGSAEIESYRSLQKALTLGEGDCKHFAVVTHYLLRQSGFSSAGIGASWAHAFNWMLDDQGELRVFDALLGGDEFCYLYDPRAQRPE